MQTSNRVLEMKRRNRALFGWIRLGMAGFGDGESLVNTLQFEYS